MKNEMRSEITSHLTFHLTSHLIFHHLSPFNCCLSVVFTVQLLFKCRLVA